MMHHSHCFKLSRVQKFVLTCFLVVKDMIFTFNKRICCGGGREGREERKKGCWAPSVDKSAGDSVHGLNPQQGRQK